jgi:succinate dehydrogenase cytochrome b subunit
VTANPGPLSKHHFLMRRLHSLSGILPIGVFLIAHLTTNSTILWGALNTRAQGGPVERGVTTFQEEVSFINGMPMLLLIEITLWVSIAFHSILGVYYARSGKNNLHSYSYSGNRRYALQRITGYFSILFIFYHIATLRWGWSFLVPGGVEWSHTAAASTLAQALQGSPTGYTNAGLAVSVFYMVGVSCVVFHFANGMWTAAITWGITTSEAGQKRWGYVCAALGVMLMGMAWSSVVGFALLDSTQAYHIENKMHNEQIETPAEDGLADADPGNPTEAKADDTNTVTIPVADPDTNG